MPTARMESLAEDRNLSESNRTTAATHKRSSFVEDWLVLRDISHASTIEVSSIHTL
jgi:hypothetical protein